MDLEELKGFRWQAWEYLRNVGRVGETQSKMLTARAVVAARGYKSHRSHILTVYAHLRSAGCVYNPDNGCWEVGRASVDSFMRTVNNAGDWTETAGYLWYDNNRLVVPIREVNHDNNR